ncbi:hypothetical protein MKX03_006021, partial [Papaver bracteatum]
ECAYLVKGHPHCTLRDTFLLRGIQFKGSAKGSPVCYSRGCKHSNIVNGTCNTDKGPPSSSSLSRPVMVDTVDGAQWSC